ncbi:MAG: hypothetical protein FWE77_00175 [Clostridia bacterium]|nr:hypothetical protein [Clostridia bacterium]
MQQNEADINEKRKQKLELIAIIGLGIATFFNAFTAFQSSQHSGAMNFLYTTTTALVNQTTTMAIMAQTESHGDRSVYMRLIELEQGWQSAPEGSDERQRAERAYLDFRERFVDENLEAAIAWSDGHYADTGEYVSPFESPAYLEELLEATMELGAMADRMAEEGNKHNAVSDRMFLMTVFYTTVMFLLGICGTLKNWKHKVAILIFSGVLFAVATVMLAQQPLFPDAEKTYADIMADFLAKYSGG